MTDYVQTWLPGDDGETYRAGDEVAILSVSQINADGTLMQTTAVADVYVIEPSKSPTWQALDPGVLFVDASDYLYVRTDDGARSVRPTYDLGGGCVIEPIRAVTINEGPTQ